MKTHANMKSLVQVLFVATLACLSAPLAQGLAVQRDLSGLVGENVLLPCDVNIQKCGGLHSIKWYRGSSRIFVYGEKSSIARAEGDYKERVELLYVANSTKSSLLVKSLQVIDEAVYKCEITYIEVRPECSVVQFINLTALIKPEYLRISRGDGSELQNSTVIGPFVEGTDMIFLCESGGGKPTPTVYWYNGTDKMNGDYSTEVGANNVGTGRNRVQMTLGRGDLNAKFECRANNEALTEPMVSWVEVDVNVRPLKMELSGVAHHVVQGTKVLLQCVVKGARPAANITWYNNSDVIHERDDIDINTNAAVKPDGTYETQSQLIFTATRYENGETLTCEASNQVILEKEEKPLKEAITLEVLYPPIVNVSPENVTVNESTDILLFCQYEANPTTLKSVKWFRDGQEIIPTSDHYEGGSVEQTTLLIKNSTRHDQGIYTCVLENDVGAQESTDSVNVAVYFKPVVTLTMDPPTPVNELDRLNITLMCKVESGNPDLLQTVRWYLDGELLKELPDCGGNSSAGLDYTFCDIDPSKLLLEVVGRSFHGNYSCVGMNEAGWGPMSPEEELIVYYPPSAASLVYEPARVVKRSSVTLSCSVEDPGRPESGTFRWLRGSHLVQDVTTANWTIDPVTLETKSNFTCQAYNDGGDGDPATVHIEVFAPPAFIERLPPYTGALMSAQNINISCRVECFPLCAIHWFKNDEVITFGDNEDTSLYMVRNTVIPPDSRSNDFESMQSTLIWNMSAWPGGQLDRINDNANYTCQSTKNDVGPGVKSTTKLGVEYPPEKIEVSNGVVSVVEGNVPDSVMCTAIAYPEASYVWKPEVKSDMVYKGNVLSLNSAMTRRNSGYYVCEASNKHGTITQKTFIDVLYKPECGITQLEQDGKIILVCTAHANPKEVDFVWRIKNENDTIEDNIEKKGLQSFLTLESGVENFRTYLCFTNNTVGMSIPCERDVTGLSLGWWERLDDKLVIIVAVIVGAILMVLIVCIVIIIVCRRKRAEDKYNNPVEMEERENGYERFVTNLRGPNIIPEGDSSEVGSGPPQPRGNPVHKWPLRPGVLVHVNGTHSLSAARLPQMSTPIGHSTPTRVTGRKERTKTSSKKLKQRRAVSMGNLKADETNQHSRANRIRQMFTNDGSKYRCDTLPGVFHGKSGVVTFKKLDGPINNGVSRKRKKPGTDPSPLATKDKFPQDTNASPNDGLLQPDEDKAFYENLPFLGIQSPPNKPFKPEFSDLDYADVDYRSYGPINYKMASIEAAEMMNNNQVKPSNLPQSPSPDLL